MSYESHIKQPMQIVELKMDMIIYKTPRLMKTLDRSFNLPSIRNYSNFPFN